MIHPSDHHGQPHGKPTSRTVMDDEGERGSLDAWAYGTQLRPDELAPGCRWVSYRGKASHG